MEQSRGNSKALPPELNAKVFYYTHPNAFEGDCERITKCEVGGKKRYRQTEGASPSYLQDCRPYCRRTCSTWLMRFLNDIPRRIGMWAGSDDEDEKEESFVSNLTNLRLALKQGISVWGSVRTGEAQEIHWTDNLGKEVSPQKLIQTICNQIQEQSLGESRLEYSLTYDTLRHRGVSCQFSGR